MSSVEIAQSPPSPVDWLKTIGRVLFVPVGIAGIVLLAQPWPLSMWPVIAVLIPVTGYCIFCLTSLYHETVHQTLCGSPTVCLWLGRFVGTLVIIPYHVYREVHVKHHAYLNSPNDWELWPYSDPNCSRGFRRVFVWLDVVFGALVSVYVYGRIYFHRESPIRSPRLRATIRAEYAACALFWLVVLGFVVAFNGWQALLLAWMIPAGMGGSYQSVRKLTEHLGMASFDPLLGTRTVVAERLWTRFFSYLNFDIFVHGPHHRHPRIRHEELAPRMRAYAAEDDLPYPLFMSYTAAFCDMLPHLVVNPGVGVNAGARMPSRPWVEVHSFVRDVTEEIIATNPADFDPALSARARRILTRPASWTVREADVLDEHERSVLGNPLVENFAHYARYSTDNTRLFFLKLYDGEMLLAVAPVTKTIRHNSLRLVRPGSRWWLTLLLGPFARSTSYMVDTSLLAFFDRSAVACVSHADATAVKRHLARYLQSKRDADGVWFSEPADDTAWTAGLGFINFSVMPMAWIELGDHATYDAWLASLSKKRRRNARDSEMAFAGGGGRVERLAYPLPADDAEQMIALIAASERRSTVASPYGDVLNHPAAFRRQPQQTLVARAGGRIVAFMSFVRHADVLWQCHGGLDYGLSLDLKAYHHLMHEAARWALELGCRGVSFGPLNNETKRRAATVLKPIVGCLWVRVPLFRPVTQLAVIPQFQIYTGPAPVSDQTPPSNRQGATEGHQGPPVAVYR